MIARKIKEGVLLIQTKSRPPEKITALNEWIKRYAAANDLVYLDYYSATVAADGTLKDGISYDGLHPNVAGYEVIRGLAAKAIEKTLNR